MSKSLIFLECRHKKVNMIQFIQSYRMNIYIIYQSKNNVCNFTKKPNKYAGTCGIGETGRWPSWSQWSRKAGTGSGGSWCRRKELLAPLPNIWLLFTIWLSTCWISCHNRLQYNAQAAKRMRERAANRKRRSHADKTGYVCFSHSHRERDKTSCQICTFPIQPHLWCVLPVGRRTPWRRDEKTVVTVSKW